MNLANKLTMSRIILLPFFVFFLLTDFVPFSPVIALILFAVASLTDALDGYVARSRNMVTVFGNFLDTLADKALVTTALVCFCELGIVGAVPVLIIVIREFMVMGLRLVTAEKAVIISAGMPGKLKAAFTMAAIIVILFVRCLNLTGEAAVIAGIAEQSLIWVAAVLTIISGGLYLKAYWGYIDYKG
ncbi:MAG: CDP-diacylglycerol--glycerol-3-phosphate 3-phosphatidyltransferase [Oscillospiraceae bacterium]|nr:CDP-diacylglycerol--glycerol-3-phosphate 3-phosphatidyltransferase [Oscillospiraceae bacterium]